MKSLRKTVLSAALLASAGLLSAPASADDAPTFVDIANSICAASGAVAPMTIAQSEGGLPADKAAAFGEAARQAVAGKCPGSDINAIEAAMKKLVELNPNFPQLQVAFDTQKGSGQKEAGDGSKGFYQDEDDHVGDNVVSTAAGEAVSR